MKMTRTKPIDCKRGHNLAEHGRLDKNGSRHCRECERYRTQKFKTEHPDLYKQSALARTKKYQAANKPKLQVAWEHRKLGKYGLTLDGYNQLLASQNQSCAICKQTCPSGKKLAVDHDHATSEVRGLLCLNCNNGLGRFRDDPELLTRAIEYLSRTKTFTLV